LVKTNKFSQIGKTSALVLTLSGVLKDILLVIASMVIFKDPVSGLQAFGYSIALVGLMYYKLGGEKIKGVVTDSARAWSEYGTRSPAMRRVITIGVVFVVLFVLLGGLAPNLPENYTPSHLKDILGKHGYGV
jgi:hypothetical protein